MSSITQLQAVERVMRDGQWHTPWGIRAVAMKQFGKVMSESAITARIRDLRKPKYGGHQVDRERIGHKDSAACRYRLVMRQEAAA